VLKNDWHPYSALGIILKDATIVTHAARSVHFPTPIADTAEQLYLQGVQANLLKVDDAAMVQIYLPSSQPSLVGEMASADVNMTASHQVSKDTIVDLLSGIHLAASVEGMAFCKNLGLDRAILCEIISKAAGYNEMFVKCVPGMLEKDEWTLADCPQAEEVGKKLGEAVEKCAKIGYPCPMASVALQQYRFAGLKKKTIGGQDRNTRQ
jgi:3-hydroxyisobutyrate dehydrogenase